MKRILTACLYQTIRFETGAELDSYLADLTKRQIAYRVDRRELEADGSAVVSIRRQYNSYRCDSYLG